ncbi:helix-turn-helix domain-containing protein [Enterococcus raffinosus]|uniref:helix-turn-helix domain-containing protein n=1 Tax=Enterococcus raffinosus TaxID=71452 RepID=UPI001C119A04|nr:helix-turn-helix transcriptional regulator [Enterococcus raffinosus]MBU5360170.1 helix-turn-helix domain-containing protein [Enterococcus raffinosus]
MKIGRKLKELRTAHGYTQEELSTILNVSRSTISSWEINRTYPDLSMLVSLSELYNITVDQLLSEDDQLVDTMTMQAKKNRLFKKIIFTLVITLISFAIIVVFLLKGNSTPDEPKITHYEFSDYSKIVTKDQSEENSAYFYNGNFVGEIIDTLPDGTETTLIQPAIINSMYNKEVTLRIKRDENHKIKKVTVVDAKNTIQLLQEEYGGQIRMLEYDSWEELEQAKKVIEASNSEQLVFMKSDDGTKVSAFFKTDKKER